MTGLNCSLRVRCSSGSLMPAGHPSISPRSKKLIVNVGNPVSNSECEQSGSESSALVCHGWLVGVKSEGDEPCFCFLRKTAGDASAGGRAIPVAEDVPVLRLDYAACQAGLSGVWQVAQPGPAKSERSKTRRMNTRRSKCFGQLLWYC